MEMAARLGTPRLLACALGVGVHMLQTELLFPSPCEHCCPAPCLSGCSKPSLKSLALNVLMWGAVTLK